MALIAQSFISPNYGGKMLDNNDEQRLRTYLKDTLANNDSLVIPKVILEVADMVGIEKTNHRANLGKFAKSLTYTFILHLHIFLSEIHQSLRQST